MQELIQIPLDAKTGVTCEIRKSEDKKFDDGVMEVVWAMKILLYFALF